MKVREENLKNFNAEHEKLNDKELDKIVGGTISFSPIIKFILEKIKKLKSEKNLS